MNILDIGRCWTCKRDPCPTPKRKAQHPELGCYRWTEKEGNVCPLCNGTGKIAILTRNIWEDCPECVKPA